MAISEIVNAPIVADAYISLGSQYIYRGVALRDSAPVITAAFTLSRRDGWFIDAWTGQVDAYDYDDNSIAREWQLELNAGYAAQFNDNWQWSLSRAWINGIDSGLSTSQNYQEWRLNFFHRENIAMQFAYTDDYQQRGWSAWNAEINYQYALTAALASEFGFGHSHGAGGANNAYNYGWAGVRSSWLKTEWNLRWMHSGSGADYVVDSNRGGSRIELMLKWALPIAH